MRILIVTNMYPYPEAPDYGVFIQEQERSLRALGLQVDLHVHLGRLSRWNYARGLAQLTHQLRSESYDLIHSHHTYSSILALAARRLARRRLPIIQTFHEGEVFHRGTDFGQDRIRRLKYSLPIKAWAMRRMDFVIPVQRDMMRRVLGEAAARVPSRVIPAGIDLARFEPEPPAAARRRLGWDPAGFYVFFPCDPIKPEKRHDLAGAGFELFRRERPDARLIIGGRIPYARMPDHIRAADVILVPTDYEASPTVVKETLACERRLVSTDVGDVRECYGDLPGVFLCDWTPESVAAQLAAAARFTPPVAGRQRLRDLGLDLDQVARRLLDVYAQVTSTSTHPA